MPSALVEVDVGSPIDLPTREASCHFSQLPATPLDAHELHHIEVLKRRSFNRVDSL